VVPRSSDRISRVPPYLIRPFVLRVRGYHPYCPASQLVPLTRKARLVRVRSPLLTEYRLISFPPGTEMFQFPGFALSTLCIQVESTCFIRLLRASRLSITECQVGCPIRRSRDQGLLSAPPGLSQIITSFIASCCLGIHQTPLSRLIRSRRYEAQTLRRRPDPHHFRSEVIDRPCRWFNRARTLFLTSGTILADQTRPLGQCF
jgi:hypothetical protein